GAGGQVGAGARLAEDRIVRAWKFGREHTDGPRVSLPATETPHAEWYRSYVESKAGD
ncbi:hypothetical protein H8E07_17365, partial [bacterium]|nr:hypothetical protein [bacterium]